MPIPITLTAHGQPVQVLQVPTSWADVTLAQWVALFAPEDGEQRTAAELLLGLEAGGLNQLAADDVPLLAGLLAFASDPSPVLELLPTPGLPDVGQIAWGCLVLVQQHFESNAERPALASLPYVLAVYRCQLAYGTTNRLAQVLAGVLAAPVTEVYADAAAFSAACRKSLSATHQTRATTKAPAMRKSTLAARIYKLVSGRLWPSMLWRKAT